MNSNKQNLINKIKYRSHYRGTKEMDKLIGRFVQKNINNFNEIQLKELEKFLDIDDANLYNFYNGFECDIEIKKSKISLLFKNFKF